MPRIPMPPADLAEVIALHKAMFGGWVMQADDPEAPQGEGEPAPDPAGGFKSPESRDSVLSDLATERSERKRLQKQIEQLQQALGVDAKSKDVDLGAEIARLTTRLDVSDLARQHGVTDADDLATLTAIADAEVRAKAAERLGSLASTGKTDASDAPNADPEVFPRPKPDASQGSKGEPVRPDPKPGMERLTQAVSEALGPK